MRRIIGVLLFTILMAAGLQAAGGETPVSWQRQATPTQPELRLFHSTAVIGLPTTETLTRGLWQFEIAHRFWPPLADGIDALYGLDGPVSMRLGLAYAPTDLLMITLARSNVSDNVDLQAKYKILRVGHRDLPFAVALLAGAAWNTEKVGTRSKGDSRNYQYYGQLIGNTMIAKRFAVGVVPSYLYNSDIFSATPEKLFSLGLYLQLYLHRVVSIQGEWTPSFGEAPRAHDPLAVGIELETGGHFFKIQITNSPYPNPSLYLAGAEEPFADNYWRLGFLITRILHF